MSWSGHMSWVVAQVEARAAAVGARAEAAMAAAVVRARAEAVRAAVEIRS